MIWKLWSMAMVLMSVAALLEPEVASAGCVVRDRGDAVGSQSATGGGDPLHEIESDSNRSTPVFPVGEHIKLSVAITRSTPVYLVGEDIKLRVTVDRDADVTVSLTDTKGHRSQPCQDAPDDQPLLRASQELWLSTHVDLPQSDDKNPRYTFTVTALRPPPDPRKMAFIEEVPDATSVTFKALIVDRP